MSKHLQRDLEKVERELVAMSSMVEEMIAHACRALSEHKPQLAEMISEQEQRIDELEVQIEDECLKILALHQPVAVDLRRVATILKINNDLERIADLAGKHRREGTVRWPTTPNSRSRTYGAKCPTPPPKMLDGALGAFVAMDSQTARALCVQDDAVDAMNRDVIEQLAHTMRNQTDLIEPCLHLLSAARHVERIADHATNISEDVIYLVEGEIARHRS